jgi:hypothetical protein
MCKVGAASGMRGEGDRALAYPVVETWRLINRDRNFCCIAISREEIKNGRGTEPRPNIPPLEEEGGMGSRGRRRSLQDSRAS